MDRLALIPIVISWILMEAHFLRSGHWVWVGICLIAPALLLWKRRWVARGMQVGLLLGAIEWFLTMLEIVGVRRELGMPAGRVGLILGFVTVFTLGSALLFETKGLRKRYGLWRDKDAKTG